MSLLKFVQKELDIIGMTEDDSDEKNVWMRRNILEIVDVFSKQGHDGFSADYAVSILQRVLLLEPLSALTGNDDEWVEVTVKEPNERVVGKLYRNVRCRRVFKDDTGAFDIEGKIFYEVKKDENGNDYQDYYITPECRTSVEFPYVLTSIYEERPRDTEGPEVTVVEQSPTVQ